MKKNTVLAVLLSMLIILSSASVYGSDWFENTSLKGDIRLRFQKEEMEDGNPSRQRGRIRARLGITSKPADNWEAGIGLATGGTDPRSTNETLDNTFETPDIRLDYAYAKYSPNKMFSITGGKIKNPIWGTKDLLWDGDIRPDGIAATYTVDLADDLELFVIPAYFLLEEFGNDDHDPSMMVVQTGASYKLNDTFSIKAALTYYEFLNLEGYDLSVHSAGTNSVDGGGNLVYTYDAVAFDYEIGINLPSDAIPFLAIFGQYVASDADDTKDMDGYDDDTGFLYGFKVGDKKVKESGDWQFKVNYRELEKDAWPDFLPDSDFYGGSTGVKGIEYEVTVGLGKNVSFGLDYYHSEPVRSVADDAQDLFQLDLVIKF